ncbi:MAG: family 78 glycoside hydrolase catalytic domain [Cyclobacteriaceae bacterium]
MKTLSPYISIYFLLVFFSAVNYSCTDSEEKDTPLNLSNPRVEYHENPEGIDVEHPRFSWELEGEGRNRSQSAYRIIVASTREKLELAEGDIWDSGKVRSNKTNQINYEGKDLISLKKYFYKVQVWDEHDQVSDWSTPGQWSMGILNFSEWNGLFIGLDVGHRTGNKYESLYLPPARYLRKSFIVDKPIKKAILTTTALGIYELSLNGAKVGDYFLTPGWTDYDKRLYYQTYDITDDLAQGENVIGSIIADGWYAGYVGYGLLVRLDKVRGYYGENPSFMGQLNIEYEDGTSEIIATDQSWKVNTGPIQEADIIMGEKYDARLEMKGWDAPGYDDESWKRPKVYTYPNGKLQAYPGSYIQEREHITPLSVKEPKPGVYVFDLGKNFAGIVSLKVKGVAGTKIQLKYGEILRADGTVMTENLRKARATDTYILKGGGVETWQPRFTYHGFQYVELTGLNEKPDPETITGIVLSSIEADASTFSTSNPMNNQLYDNIITTQLANFFEVPTDCPQRDERLGWTGDAQIYCRSASFNADVAAFFTKFMIDLDDAQRWYGAYPNFAPFPYSRPNQYSPAWMDAGVIIPYTMYKVYGDTRMIEYMYPGMEKFMAFQADASTGFLRPGGGNNWGDWLSVDETTSHDYIASAFYGYDADLMSRMAEAIGKASDAVRYRSLFENIKSAFAEKYIKADGHTIEDSQTSYALALYFNLYPEELAQKGAARLAEKIKANGNKFSSGFLGTKYIMLVLSQYGYAELAYKLFKQTAYPSWGYSVVNGSTSIWERWNSYTKDADQNSSINAAMNSFSHYAFGSVAEWMFIHALGIDSEGSGYRNIIIDPVVSREMDHMKGSYHSINGLITSAWSWKGDRFELEVSVPGNTRAEIHIPSTAFSSIRESGNLLSEVPEIKVLNSQNHDPTVLVGSGRYLFTSMLK